MAQDPHLAAAAFSGHRGFWVAADQGELDPGDLVRRFEVDRGRLGVYEPELGDRLGPAVAWHDADYAAARGDYLRLDVKVQDAGQRVAQGIAALKRGEKPPETAFDAVIRSALEVAGSIEVPSPVSPHLRAAAHSVAGAAWACIADDYRSLTAQIEPARQGYLLVKNAFETAPDHPVASFSYAVANTAILLLPNSWPLRLRNRAHDTLGIEAALELSRVIEVLRRHPDEYPAQAALLLAAETWKATPDRRGERLADLDKRRRELGERERELARAQAGRDPTRTAAISRDVVERRARLERAEALTRISPGFDAAVDGIIAAARARVAALAPRNPQLTRDTDEALKRLRGDLERARAELAQAYLV